jgi:CelD/BcsL family acetyltransferase involved in cellulose biosynthesis
VRLDVHDETRTFTGLSEAWDRLHTLAGLLGPFSRFGWQFDWWRSLGPGRSLRLVVARRAGDVVGILPLFEEPGPIRTLALVGSQGGGSDYLDVIAADPDVRRALLVHAVHALRPDALLLDDLLDDSPTVPLLFALSRGRTTVSARYPCPYVDLRAAPPIRPRAETIGRRTRWLSSLPGHRIDVETSHDACAPFQVRFRRLHEARWRDNGGTQAFPDGRLWTFHERAMERLADAGRLRLWTMWVAGEAVAVAWTFDDDGRSLYYQCGYSPEWGSRSVGQVLLETFIEDARRRGLAEVDFLRGGEPYKWEWTRTARRTVRLFWPLTAAAKAADVARSIARTGRSVLRGMLPEPLVRTMTRTVRSARMRAPQLSQEESA